MRCYLDNYGSLIISFLTKNCCPDIVKRDRSITVFNINIKGWVNISLPTWKSYGRDITLIFSHSDSLSKGMKAGHGFITLETSLGDQTLIIIK